MLYQVSHLTRYVSETKVSIGMNQMHLSPRTTAWQTCLEHEILTTPGPSVRDIRGDAFGNTVGYFFFESGYQSLEIRALSRVEVLPRPRLDPESSPAWESIVASVERERSGEWLRAMEMTVPSPHVDWTGSELADYARESFSPGKPVVAGLAALLDRFHDDFEFDAESTTVSTTVTEVFELRKGVCQDFAHAFIAMLRSIGLPARYVSGYLRTHAPEGKPRLRGADASHAWVALYAGELGWIELDPTNRCFISQDHITTAWGRDYSDVNPVCGIVIGSGLHSLHVEVDVDEITESGDVPLVP